MVGYNRKAWLAVKIVMKMFDSPNDSKAFLLNCCIFHFTWPQLATCIRDNHLFVILFLCEHDAYSAVTCVCLQNEMAVIIRAS